MSVADYKLLRAASDDFLGYLVKRYTPARLDEELRPCLMLACCYDALGWQVCLPINPGGEDIVESLRLQDEGVRTRGELIEFMRSTDWIETMQWITDVGHVRIIE